MKSIKLIAYLALALLFPLYLWALARHDVTEQANKEKEQQQFDRVMLLTQQALMNNISESRNNPPPPPPLEDSRFQKSIDSLIVLEMISFKRPVQPFQFPSNLDITVHVPDLAIFKPTPPADPADTASLLHYYNLYEEGPTPLLELTAYQKKGPPQLSCQTVVLTNTSLTEDAIIDTVILPPPVTFANAPPPPPNQIIRRNSQFPISFCFPNQGNKTESIAINGHFEADSGRLHRGQINKFTVYIEARVK